jgi:hypothetical protein
MKQHYLVGEKVRVTFVGIIKEAYTGYDSITHSDIIKYKVESGAGTGLALIEEVLTTLEATPTKEDSHD